MTYSDKLKDPKWQKVRLQVLERDDWRCRICDIGTKTLHIHHNFYQQNREPWDYPFDSLITLCFECHEREKGYRLVAEDSLLEALREYGFTSEDISILILERILNKEIINGLEEAKKSDLIVAEYLERRNKSDESLGQ